MVTGHVEWSVAMTGRIFSPTCGFECVQKDEQADEMNRQRGERDTSLKVPWLPWIGASIRRPLVHHSRLGSVFGKSYHMAISGAGTASH